ncbi:MAG TPA: ureidoglycolate lyase [Stellaceae bacterium]|nr:ureidoglycolate lyase [Stellaceae bacterium]
MSGTSIPRHKLAVRALTASAFAPFGQIVEPRRAMGQGQGPAYDPARNPAEAQLVLHHGQPRIWLMHLPHVGLAFTRIARHRRVTQCLGALNGAEWLIAVAPPGDPADTARPRLDEIAAFRINGDRVIKLHVATWHAGPHFVQSECTFLNLENMDTNERDFHSVDLGVN